METQAHQPPLDREEKLLSDIAYGCGDAKECLAWSYRLSHLCPGIIAAILQDLVRNCKSLDASGLSASFFCDAITLENRVTLNRLHTHFLS